MKYHVCPQCHHQLAYPEAAAGKTAACPKCKTQTQLPKATGPTPALPPPPPPFPRPTSARPASPASPTVSTAPVSGPAPAGMVSFACPRCHKQVTAKTLRKPVEKPVAPQTIGGKIMGLFTSMLGEIPIDDTNLPVNCPHCQADFPACEVESLQNELLLACPHCAKMKLTSPLAVGAIQTCDHCKRGFTPGMAANSKGTITDRPQLVNQQHADSTQLLTARFQCQQENVQFEYGSGKNEVNKRLLTQNHEIQLLEPETAKSEYQQLCPCCKRELKFVVTSVSEADAKAAAAQQLARYLAWVWIVVPVVILFLIVRYAMGFIADNQPVPALDVFAVLGGIFGALLGSYGLIARTDSARQQALLPNQRVVLVSQKLDEPLWRTSGMYTKGANLEIRHGLVAVDKCDSKV